MRLRLATPDTDPVEGDERQVRHDAQQQHRTRLAMRSNLPEIARSDLRFGKFGQVEQISTGKLFRRIRGEVGDRQFSNAAAFFIDRSGVVYLEPPAGGPKTRNEIEERKAQRAARRAATSRTRFRAT